MSTATIKKHKQSENPVSILMLNDLTQMSLMCSSFQKNYVEINGIRITPAKLLFTDAFEGRKYEEYIEIQNCGKLSAQVRILQPTSYVRNCILVI